MTANLNILDQPEPVKKAFVAAVGLHLGLIATAGIGNWIIHNYTTLGDKTAGGAAVGIETVDSIPLPHQGPKNPLANDTESTTQQAPPKPERARKEVAPPDAIPLKVRKSKTKVAPEASEKQQYRPYKTLDPYKVYNKSAPAISSEIFSAAPGSGNIGAGPHNPLGDNFGGYAAQIRDIVARHWHTTDVDSRVQSAPMVMVHFDLYRDGSIRNMKFLQSSGVPSLDNSVQRALLDSNPLPPLPPAYKDDHAPLEFWFELKR